MRSRLKRRAFAPLANEGLFMQAHREGGSVVWNEDIDIAPETLYDEGIPIGDETHDQRVLAAH